MTRMLAATAALCAFALPQAALAQDFVQFGVGADYSSGDYGEDADTTMLAVPVSAKLKTGDLAVRVSVPWVSVDGPTGVIPGDGGVRGPGRGNGGGGTDPVETASRSGLGDIVAAATYSFGLSDATYFDVTGKVKLPTASVEKSLGTGTTDFTLQGELMQVFGDVSAAVRAGRRFNGESDDFALDDVWLGGASLFLVSGDTTWGLDYDWRDGSLPTAPNRSEVTGSATHKLSDGLRLQGYAYTGLADGSPDIGGGVQVLVRLGR
ncbi:hypothetical protein [Qipengyuania vesicularis]|uniref:hypothetical protein n=1 Tax=Qipengyuania vesicularis TaxID=2867232 RepID=UPI001C87E020|nr:hypothetical protein [Qipengyuania vesicularis]MBX7527228.1 hypothetical protein [Qipengyuania vesicularis]